MIAAGRGTIARRLADGCCPSCRSMLTTTDPKEDVIMRDCIVCGLKIVNRDIRDEKK
jgi:Zn ribbon nucleic-acid-binding protein